MLELGLSDMKQQKKTDYSYLQFVIEILAYTALGEISLSKSNKHNAFLRPASPSLSPYEHTLISFPSLNGNPT